VLLIGGHMNLQELHSLVRLGSIFQWLAIVLVFLAGALQVSKFVLDRKVQNLRQGIESKRTMHYEQTISKLKQRLAQQIERVQVVLEQEKRRTIPGHLIPRIKEDLAKYSGTSIRLNCVRGDREALGLSKELKDLFQQAGWRVNGINQVPYPGPIQDIVIILNNTSQRQKANYIFSLFRTLRFKTTARLDKNQKEDLCLLIGKRG